MKPLIFLCLTLITQSTFGQVTRVVSKGGTTLPPELLGFPQDTTLLDAYCAISTINSLSPCPDTVAPYGGPYFVSSTYNIILYGNTPISVGTNTLIWEKSGTSTHSINIYSYKEQATLRRPASETNGSVLKLLNVQNVNIFNVHFENATHAITMDNADHCSITYCRFTGEEVNGQMMDAAIWIGKGAIQGFDSANFSQSANNYPEASYQNEIAYNLFEDQKFTDYCLSRFNHGIYVSHGNVDNVIYGNTIRFRQTNVAPYPIGLGIHINHGYAKYNTISRNFIDQYYYKTILLESCSQPNNPVCPPANYDQWQHSRYGIDLNTDAGPPLSSITDNEIVGNYLSTNINIECSVEPTLAFYADSTLRVTNEVPSISESSYSHDLNHYYDPYWIPHATGSLSAVATASGDFDDDGKIDDIAVLYEYPGAVTKIHLWKFLDGQQLLDADPDYKQVAFFEYQGVKWSSVGLGGFNADKIRGRVVSGSFDNDGNKDDIATIYDNGTGGIEINMFLWNNSTAEFDYEGGSNNWKSFSSGFTASMVTGRVVAGDFNHDNIDDIATFYPKNTTGCDINMFLSTGSSFDYQGASQAWWSVSSGFNLNKVTDRIVSGDFDNDGKTNDIAAFFDAGNNNTEVEMFRSNGTSFDYEGGSLNWWTNSGFTFDSNKVKGRLVSGDFDGDSKPDDIAVLYDEGSNSMRIDLFRSNGAKPFVYEGDASAWWSTDGYGGLDANKTTGHVVSGNFSSANGADDIMAFYDYSSISGNTRTNVWESDGSSFEFVNGALGYPWAAASGAIEGRLKTNREKTVEQEAKTAKIHQINGLSVYPNPTSKVITIQYDLNVDAVVSILLCATDGHQSEILRDEQVKGRHEMEINVTDFKPGLYIVLLKFNSTLLTRKFVVKVN